MKIDIFKTVIALVASALIAFGFFSFYHGDNKNLLVIGCFFELLITGFLYLGLHFEQKRTTTLVRIVSSIFFVVFLITNLVFSFINYSYETYIIVNGLMLLAYLLIIYILLKAKQ